MDYDREMFRDPIRCLISQVLLTPRLFFFVIGNINEST